MTMSIIDAESRRKQAQNYYVRQIERAINEIDKIIQVKAEQGQYHITINMMNYKNKYQLSLDSICYIYNCFLKAGFKIEETSRDIENEYYWKINWRE